MKRMEIGIDPADAELDEGHPLHPDAVDIDVSDWLTDDAGDARGTATVTVKGEARTLHIAAITEGEENLIMKMARKPNPRGGGMGKPDFTQYRLLQIAFSLNKAKGLNFNSEGSITPELLKRRPSGELTEIQRAILELSGMREDPNNKPDVGDFFA